MSDETTGLTVPTDAQFFRVACLVLAASDTPILEAGAILRLAGDIYKADCDAVIGWLGAYERQRMDQGHDDYVEACAALGIQSHTLTETLQDNAQRRQDAAANPLVDAIADSLTHAVMGPADKATGETK